MGWMTFQKAIGRPPETQKSGPNRIDHPRNQSERYRPTLLPPCHYLEAGECCNRSIASKLCLTKRPQNRVCFYVLDTEITQVQYSFCPSKTGALRAIIAMARNGVQ